MELNLIKQLAIFIGNPEVWTATYNLKGDIKGRVLTVDIFRIGWSI